MKESVKKNCLNDSVLKVLTVSIDFKSNERDFQNSGTRTSKAHSPLDQPEILIWNIETCRWHLAVVKLY